MNLQIAFIGYLAAAFAFAVLTVLLLTKWRQRVRGSVLTVACIVTMFWALAIAWSIIPPGVSAERMLVFEMAHDWVWLFFLSSLLSGAVAVESNWLVRKGGVVLGGCLFIIALLLDFGGLGQRMPSASGSLLVMGSIATSLYALVGIEQLYRNARPSQQNGLKFLCLGLAGIFAYDILLYTTAIVDGTIPSGLWAARGFVVALCMPLLAVSVQRVPTWKRGIFASRQIVFYTTTLFAAGLYLTLIGFAGYYIQTLGKEWTDVLSLVFVSAATIGFFALLLSEQLRARVRVWIVKHFFERKYDYRAEWLRLIHTLTDSSEGLPLKKRAIMALAQILDSPSGVLWLRNQESGAVVAVAGWNVQEQPGELAADAPLVTFLADKAWVLDLAELADQPGKYLPLESSDIPGQIDDAGYLVPLFHEEELLGFVALAKPKTPFTLNFEDHDLLKTAGQQIASYLAQEMATENLAESRQFEAYNRFTAFVMHDLKNAIAQQSLVVENAEKHKHNPEFIDDAIETISGSVARMRRVISHLRQSTVEQSVETVDLGRIVLEVASHCADREPVPGTDVPDQRVPVLVNRERVAAAISHAVRNAQEACEPGGEVRIVLEAEPGECTLKIIDTGEGMDKDFVRDRLFRPFDSTKGAEGMGIGAYQIRETVRAANGDVEVDSTPGEGTTFLIRLPVIAKDDQ